MTDPGWAIPGVPLDVPASAGEAPGGDSHQAARASRPAGPGSPGRTATSAPRRRPAASASAAAGSSAGAFAGPASTPPPAGPGGGAPGDAGLGRSSPAPGGVQAADPVQALAYLRAGLEYLARADAADWTAGLQADCLRALAVAESQHAAAHARVLAAFAVPGGGLAGDGHRSPRVWLTWQTRATRRAAAGHAARMRTLQAHPLVAAALAAGQLSLSWARQITDWTSVLPDDAPGGADAELLAAAAAGTDLPGLAGIAEEQHRRHAAPDNEDDGFDDRAVRARRHLRRRRPARRRPDRPLRRRRPGRPRLPAASAAPKTPAPWPSAATTPSRKPAPGSSPPTACRSGPGSPSASS